MERGDVVRPTAAVIEAVQRYTAESRLVVRLAKTSHLCTGCYRVAKHQLIQDRIAKGKDPLPHSGELSRLARENEHVIPAGELYAASGEVSSSLCLGCVEEVA